MSEFEEYNVNEIMKAIRNVQDKLQERSKDNKFADGRHVAMVLTKLEEAELLSQRILKAFPRKVE